MKALLTILFAVLQTVSSYSSENSYPLTIEIQSSISAKKETAGFGTCQEPGRLPHLCNNARHTNTYVVVKATMDGTDYQFACKDGFHRCPMLQPHHAYRARWVKDGRGIELQEPKSTFWAVAAGENQE